MSKRVQPARSAPFGENTTAILILAAFTVAGVVGAFNLPFGESLTVAQRIFGGAIAGFFFGLFPLGVRLFE